MLSLADFLVLQSAPDHSHYMFQNLPFPQANKAEILEGLER